jgi:hypothetical protein
MARLAADYPRDMAMSGGIVGEHHIPGPETFYGTVAGFDFNLASERNDILAPRRVVKIAPMGGRRAPEEYPMCRLEFGNLHMSLEIKLNAYFFKMGFVVRSGEKSDDLHQPGCRRIPYKKQEYGEALRLRTTKVRSGFIAFHL